MRFSKIQNFHLANRPNVHPFPHLNSNKVPGVYLIKFKRCVCKYHQRFNQIKMSKLNLSNRVAQFALIEHQSVCEPEKL